MNQIHQTKDRTTVSPAEMSKEELVAAYEALFKSTAPVDDDDASSLAQPSPYRFVPSTLSGSSGSQG